MVLPSASESMETGEPTPWLLSSTQKENLYGQKISGSIFKDKGNSIIADNEGNVYLTGVLNSGGADDK